MKITTEVRHAPRERVSWNSKASEEQSDLKKSRSTWACELKFFSPDNTPKEQRHAPRERVSWNIRVITYEGSIYGVTLHVSVWVEMQKRKLD